MEYNMALIQTYDKINQNGKKFKTSTDICRCDVCGVEFEQRSVATKARRLGKTANGSDLCKACAVAETTKRLVAKGTIALSKLSPERRKEIASIAGKKAAELYDPTTNNSRFTTERWNEKTDEEKHLQVTRANATLHEKLKDPILAAQHYAKIFSQSKIGYQSKGHKDLHALIEHLGFNSHVNISNMQVDECNEDKKIVIEYNGDMWHCNPQKWKASDYNSAIKMTAGEKWEKDIVRYKCLESLGYKIIIIWESGWKENAQKYINKIQEMCDETN